MPVSTFSELDVVDKSETDFSDLSTEGAIPTGAPRRERRAPAAPPEPDRPLKTLRQVVNLRELQRDWDGYNAEPINPRAMVSAIQFIVEWDDKAIGPPRVVPMTRGRLQFEWNHVSRSLEIEFDAPGEVHYLKWSDALQEEGVVAQSDKAQVAALLEWLAEG